MAWTDFTSLKQLSYENSVSNSSAPKAVIFKHSTRCAISVMAWGRLKRYFNQDVSGVDFYYLDLLKNRNLSDEISTHFNVTHQSPQVLIIQKGECVYHASHNGIDPHEMQSYFE